MKWHAKQWSDLTRDELHAMVRLRIDVFVVEQDCPYSDLDGKDLRAWHVWAEDEKEQEQLKSKLHKPVVKPHTARGFVKSLTGYFAVPKDEGDIRIV